MAGNHNYFVGKLRLLAHNARCPELFGGNVKDGKLLDLAEDYLKQGNRGYSEVSPGRYISDDGLRQFRFGKHEISSNPFHAHFESYNYSYFRGGTLTENTVVNVVP